VATIACNYAIDFYRKKQLPITDDFDLSVINELHAMVATQVSGLAFFEL
jgi:hypothetical protein